MKAYLVAIGVTLFFMIILLAYLLGARNAKMNYCHEKGGVFLMSEEVCVKLEVL